MEQNASPDPEQPTTKTSDNPLKTLIGCALLAVVATGLLFFLPWEVIGVGVLSVLSALWGATGTVVSNLLSGLHAISKPLAAVAVATGLTGFCFIHKISNPHHSRWAVLAVGLSLSTLVLISIALMAARPTSNILSSYDHYPTSHDLLHSLTPEQAVELKTIWKENRSWEADRRQTTELLGSRVDSMGKNEFRWFRWALNSSQRGREQSLTRPGCEKFVRAYQEPDISPYAVLSINGEDVSRASGASTCRSDRLNTVRAYFDFPELE